MPKLIVTGQDGKTREFLVGSALTIGRSPGNDIQIREEKASRNHCRVWQHGGNILVEDLESSNGTRVNGGKINKYILSHGDTITIGKTTILFDENDIEENVPGKPGLDFPDGDRTFLMPPSAKKRELEAPRKPPSATRLVVGKGEDNLIGRTVGGYKIESRLGQGGMGTVYRARQISMDRDVALKVLRKDLAEDSTFVKSFLREARFAGSCTHPCIVGIHDFGEQDGVLYFSMELVEGETLHELLKRERKLSVERALSICISIAEALVHAAKMNVVHRDIKPHNIMISQRKEVKLADLGLATRGGQPAAGDKPNAIQGTPPYMAPELIRKESIDGRADIYALGITLFQMLTGRVPFDHPDKLVLLKKHLTEARPDPRASDPTIPSPVAELILRMIAADPATRPTSAASLLTELKEIQKNLGQPGPPLISLDKENDAEHLENDGRLAGVMNVIEVSGPSVVLAAAVRNAAEKKVDPAPGPRESDQSGEAPKAIEPRPRQNDPPPEPPHAEHLHGILPGVIAGIVFLVVLGLGVNYFINKNNPPVTSGPTPSQPSLPQSEQAGTNPASGDLRGSPTVATPPGEIPKRPEKSLKPPGNPGIATAPIDPAVAGELNAALGERDKALASGNFLRARGLIAAFLTAHPEGAAGIRAARELKDTAVLIDSALTIQLKDAEKAAERKKFRIAMQRCTALISADPAGKFGQAARGILTRADEVTQPLFVSYHARAAEQAKAGQLEKAGETLGQALDELDGTKWAAQVSSDQLQIVMANSLLKQLETGRAKKAAEGVSMPVVLASKKLEGNLTRVNGVVLELKSGEIELAVRIKEMDPADFAKILQAVNLADRHLELAYLWVVLDRKDAAKAEVELALENPQQASDAARLATSIGTVHNLHVYDFKHWQQQSDWEAVSGIWSTQNGRYVLDSAEGGDTSLKKDAIGGPFPAKNARISFNFELIKPGANYNLTFEFGEEQRAISTIFSATGMVLNSNLDGAMSLKIPWINALSHVELAVTDNTLALSINGKTVKTIEIANLSSFKGTLTFRARETACAIDNVILRNAK